MIEIREPDDIDVLRYVLGGAYRARSRLERVSESMADLAAWMDAPLGGARYTPTPRSRSHGDGAATAVLRMAEIEDRFEKQRAEAASAVETVISVVALLPMGSRERDVCEMRHVRLMDWKLVAAQMALSKRHVLRIHEGALHALLELEEIGPYLDAARAKCRRWAVVREHTRRAKNRGPKNSMGAGPENPGPEIPADLEPED